MRTPLKASARTLRFTSEFLSKSPPAILCAIEHERARIAQDLHDDICQMLTGVSCLVQVSAGRLASRAPAESKRLHDINKRVIEAMNSARAICHGLHPTHAPGTNLRETLLEIARLSRERYAVRIHPPEPASNAQLPRHSPRQLLLVFRIVQEAICNAVRHGSASEIALRLTSPKEDSLRLRVEDNGIGLRPSKYNRDGLGLHIMRCRANELGGEITMGANPSPQKGAYMQLAYFPNQTTDAKSSFPPPPYLHP